MKIPITDGAGFIGTYLSRAIAQRGWDVCILDIIPQPDKDCNYKYCHADIREDGNLKKVSEGVDYIVHLAAKHHDFGKNTA